MDLFAFADGKVQSAVTMWQHVLDPQNAFVLYDKLTFSSDKDKLRQRIGATMQVLVDSAPAMGRKGGVGRSYADAPEIDGRVMLLPPEKISKQLKVGEFTRARIVDTQGHDLVAVPV